MAKISLTPLELANRFLKHIGVNHFVVDRALIPSLFEEEILCKRLTKSDIILKNKIGDPSDETHIYINRTFWQALFSSAQLSTYSAQRIQSNNQLSNQDVKIFEANIRYDLDRRAKITSSLIAPSVSVGAYNISNNILDSSFTKWFNEHNHSVQLHIGQDTDGVEFKDLRVGLLTDDYLILLKYANSDCVLVIAIPSEFAAKYQLKNQQKINRKKTQKQIDEADRYEEADYVYSSKSNNKDIKGVQTPLSPLPAPKGTARHGSSKVKYQGNDRIGKGAIEKANYKCEYDNTHISFISDKTSKLYMEPHHLIPISMQGLYDKSIDITPNLICLCPNCHKKIHFGEKKDVKKMLTKFYNERVKDLKKCSINIDLNTLLAYYDIY